MDRYAALAHLLVAETAGAVLLSGPAHIRWLTGFSGSSGLVLATASHTTLITDGRYAAQAQAETTGVRVLICESDPLESLIERELLEDLPLLIQPEYLTGSQLERLRACRPRLDLRLSEGLLQRAIAGKDDGEVDKIKQAQRISEEVFDHLLGWVKTGMREFEIGAEVVYQHLKRGADRMAFEPIVASGPNSAMPHARPTGRTLHHGDVLLLDFGCVWEGYCSDMTRTVCLGKASSRILRVHEIVREAQQLAIANARADMVARELDDIARSFIEGHGYGDQFTHSLGHGVGLQIHEWPRISRRSDEPLPQRSVVTIEPGIYLPNDFGVRIEDMVLLGADGCENLTSAPADLIAL